MVSAMIYEFAKPFGWKESQWIALLPYDQHFCLGSIVYIWEKVCVGGINDPTNVLK